MSTEDNTPVDPMDTDLDTFSTEFFGQNEAEPEPASSDVEKETEESDANQEVEDTHADEDDDTLAPDNDDETEEAEEEAPKPKKNRFQERIDELTSKAREAERKAADLEAKFEEFKQSQKREPEPKEEAPVVKPTTGPTPTDVKEDGTEKYPLGEFDPQYIRDLTLHTLKEERAIEEAAAKERTAKAAIEKERAELETNWNEKLSPAKERYPDFDDKGQQLLSTFKKIDQAYGEYLASTLMAMDYGPDVLYYLGNNLDEAQKIVNLGPTKAAIALGRLESKFADVEEEKQRARPKVSQAPVPPEHQNKGTSAAKPAIRGDEDDLDAFAAELFKKR